MRLRVLGGAAVLLALTSCVAGGRASERTVVITIEHSRFSLLDVDVEQGTTVRFLIHNLDPIDHEFIVGDEAAQQKHEVGRQRHHHGTIPGEVSVPAGTSRTTTFTFSRPGSVVFGCHLPGHYAYGMKGAITVD